MQHISQHLQKTNTPSAPSLTTKPISSKNGESEIRQALQDKTLQEASNEELDQAFRYVFMTVGMRAQYYPNELSTLFLYDFVRSEYGRHTLSEVRLAFRKAIMGEFPDLRDEDAKVYDYFTPAYFACVMKHYRLWASDVGNRVADERYVEQLKALPAPTRPVDWRETLEQDYQYFLQGLDTSATYPTEHYDTLVADGLIGADFWQKKLAAAKTALLHDLNRQLVVLSQQVAGVEGEQKTALKQYYAVKTLLDQYASGERDRDFELAAKQRVIRAFFRYNQELGNAHIYQQKT